ncbi:hypothetical protein HMPREF0731_4698 [Pseudoroseomonas cervicalis ATCC 49957]|uniref:Uncharacterized protein n=1 Tax=Pseudoroseomonas cervicalis ATCC 49957 TaxID=525371 RepID=D5RUD6_9PROT|nr:hypothetical protein HMPREF0731_4698 [Pseudoroseomonas cervicalis ATCC 49957]
MRLLLRRRKRGGAGAGRPCPVRVAGRVRHFAVCVAHTSMLC